MNRVEIETKLNEGRNLILGHITSLSDEQLHRPLTPSEHDPDNLWSALDHLAHLALIERDFVRMIRRHLEGDANPVGLLTGPDGSTRTREQVMAQVHKMTEEFQRTHHDDSLSEVVALTAAARGATLQLLAELTDAQLDETLPGAPWGDGTIGGVLAANSDHGHVHWKWVSAAGVAEAS